MADEPSIRVNLEKLAELSPEARARVERTIKSQIESELVKGAGGASSPAGKEFSRGIIFSRSRGKLEGLEDRHILEEMKGMDDATFNKFAARLAHLKTLKGGGLGGPG